MVFLLSLFLTALLGFVAHRAGLCTVAAVTEMLENRRARVLAGFAKTALWAVAVSLPILWLWPERGMAEQLHALTIIALLGGFLFGMGAALNGGCAFSTLGRLVDGELWMLATLTGFCAGVAAWFTARQVMLLAPASPLTGSMTAPGPMALVLLAALWLWCGWELRRLWRSREQGRSWGEHLCAHRYGLSAGALVLGVSSGILYTLHGAWTYTTTLKREVESLFRPEAGPSLLLLSLFLAMIAGMALSSWQRGGFRMQWGTPGSWLKRLGAGFLMGVGGALVPGGNDELILRAIPAFSPHALPAYLALLVGVACGLGLQRLGPRRSAHCAGRLPPLRS